MKEEATKLVVASNTGNALHPNIWNQINLDRPSDGGGGGRLGPTGSNSGGTNEVMVDHTDTVHRRDEYISSSSDASFPSTCNNPYKFQGEMVHFTSVQWKELERQAMIYKYMISSVPVPPHLLYPPPSSLYSVGYSKNGGGMEAGRCKRTDGKKWRCSRDVAPHQKYCERHLHRGRGPRSRKPVEEEEEEEVGVVVVSNNKSKYKNNGHDHHKKPRVDEQTPKHFTPANDARTDLTSRDLGLTVESDMVTQQKWHHLLEANMGFTNEGSSLYGSSGAIFHQEYYNADRYPSVQHLHHGLSYSSFPASEIGIGPPIGFTDAWSIDNLNNNINQNVHVKSSLITNEENFSPWLNLSMAGGDVLDEEIMGNVRTSDGVDFCYGDARLLLSPICREAFGPGGPLGEVLCGNPQDSTVSSPSSGVLQRSLFSSHSDGSVCNSPSEIAFQRIN
ncbi:hypothetical protein OROMI_027490 [Orobanche minor]